MYRVIDSLPLLFESSFATRCGPLHCGRTFSSTRQYTDKEKGDITMYLTK